MTELFEVMLWDLELMMSAMHHDQHDRLPNKRALLSCHIGIPSQRESERTCLQSHLRSGPPCATCPASPVQPPSPYWQSEPSCRVLGQADHQASGEV